MRTAEKYKEMGYVELSNERVQDRHGIVYYPKKAKKPQDAIKLFCRECMGMDRRKQSQVENVELVRDCTDPMCPLFDFRLGKNPFYRVNQSEEQRKASAKRLALVRGGTETVGVGDEN
jgi:hypothetical protein